MKFSVEFFPPKDIAALEELRPVITDYAQCAQPEYVSLTCGAMGSALNLDNSFSIIEHMRKQGLQVAAHLPHGAMSRAGSMGLLEKFRAAGAEMVLALRGDPPNQKKYVPHPEGYASTADFVSDIKNRHPEMPVFVAGYPEKHPESKDMEFDLENLRKKVDAGAAGIIGQFCFSAKTVAEWRDNCHTHRINASFMPGVISILNYARISAIAEKCGAAIPETIRKQFDVTDLDATQNRQRAISIMETQLQELADIDEEHIHVYALNRPEFIGLLGRMAEYAEV